MNETPVVYVTFHSKKNIIWLCYSVYWREKKKKVKIKAGKFGKALKDLNVLPLLEIT